MATLERDAVASAATPVSDVGEKADFYSTLAPKQFGGAELLQSGGSAPTTDVEKAAMIAIAQEGLPKLTG